MFRVTIFADAEVGKIFTQISVVESEAFIKLDEKDFFEKKMINKRKQWILDGLDPDEEEEKYLNTKRARHDRKKKRKKSVKSKSESADCK